ncbi:hypothetical protein HN924_01645 [Candidatus Woesearchaeota archaeon]|jgi:hypothetical protein|nr:hypothetical protein [Candidatus Woesearchaeota archaeon]MBT7062652.1 hypothetical protein [Candidatus Woesearchaeota archaeon]MBT7403127.1 hypothetical protein [Candidatus Woesearchaeota archaeon]
MASIEIKDNINKWLDVIKEKHAEKGLVRHRVLFEVNGLQLKLTNSSNFENEGKLKELLDKTDFSESDIQKIRDGVDQMYAHYKEHGNGHWVNDDGEVKVYRYIKDDNSGRILY